MNEKKREKIALLAKEANRKREHFEMLGMVNTAVDRKEREKQAVEYQIAHAEMIEAENALYKLTTPDQHKAG